MEEIIDLTSSTPPHPKNTPQRPSLTKAHTNPPVSARSNSNYFSSDDFDYSVFDFDNDFIKPAKRRRLGDESFKLQDQNTNASRPPNPLFLFSDEDPIVPSSAKKGAPGVNNDNQNKNDKKFTFDWEGSDPIIFTSSAPETGNQGSVSRDTGLRRSVTFTIDDDDGGVGSRGRYGNRRDEIEEFSDQLPLSDLEELIGSPENKVHTTSHGLSSKTASLLASLENHSETFTSVTGRGGKGKGKDKKEYNVFEEDLSDGFVEPVKPSRKSSKPSTEEKEAKARERAAAKAQRERERELEKERKQKLKEEKAREKKLAADISEANKLKIDKKESTPEMILDMALSLEGSSIANQAVEFMKRLGVEYTFFSSPISNIVKWRRKTTAIFNDSLGHWEPCPLFVKQEEHVLCLVPAQEFVNMVLASEDSVSGEQSLHAHVLKIKSTYPGCKPIYLIEGLAAWMRKNRNSRNKAYQAEVLRQMNDHFPSAQPRRRRKPETIPPVDDDKIEDGLLQLQVTYSCLIHHTNAAPESAEWIKNFTEHVSTVPYRRERMVNNDSAFCMDVGQVKTGEDKTDTFVKMLQEITRVTGSMAYGIVSKYPSVTDLIRAMRIHGPLTLEDVKKSANKNGALTDARIGPAVSKRLYKVFMGLDPSSTDV